MNFSKKTIDDINSTFPEIKKFKYQLNQFVYAIEFFESIVAFKIDRNLCFENKLLENSGFKANNTDKTLNIRFINFRKRFNFLYNFRIIKKIERIVIKLFYRYKSKKLKKFFK